MATSCTSVSSGSYFKTCELRSTKLNSLGQPLRVAFQKKKSNHSGSNRRLSVCAEYSDGGRGGGGDFIAGFLLGSTVFGTLGYIFAPQLWVTVAAFLSTHAQLVAAVGKPFLASSATGNHQEMMSSSLWLDSFSIRPNPISALNGLMQIGLDVPSLHQIRRAVLNEDEYGFQRARRPIYYDEGLEKTRKTLNAKISQLNSIIDKVSSRLKGGNKAVKEPMETDAEVEATI